MNDLTTALNEIVTLRAAISRVQDLHRINGYDDLCDGCGYSWPCATITAIGKTP